MHTHPANSAQSVTLSSGVTLVHIHDPSSAKTHCRVRFEAGALYDPVGKEGLAHLTEHMIAQSLVDRKWDKDARTFFNQTSGTFDFGATSAQSISYNFSFVANEELFYRLCRAWDRLFFEPFNSEQLAVQQTIITQEFAESYHNPTLYRLCKRLSQQLWPHKQRFAIPSVLGEPETISACTMSDVLSFWRTYVIPSRMIVVVYTPLTLEQCYKNLEGAISIKSEVANSSLATHYTRPHVLDSPFSFYSATRFPGLGYRFSGRLWLNTALSAPANIHSLASNRLLSLMLNSSVYASVREMHGAAYSARATMAHRGVAFEHDISIPAFEYRRHEKIPAIVEAAIEDAFTPAWFDASLRGHLARLQIEHEVISPRDVVEFYATLVGDYREFLNPAAVLAYYRQLEFGHVESLRSWFLSHAMAGLIIIP